MSRRRRKIEAENQKGKNNTTQESRRSKRQISSAAIEAVRRVVEIIKPFELSASQRNKTFAAMLQDDCVFAGFDNRAVGIELAQANGKFEYKRESEESVALKKFLEYNMKQLKGQSPRSVGRSCAEMIIYGFAPHEVSYIKNPNGEYPEDFLLNKVQYVHPLSLSPSQPFKVKEGGSEIEYMCQSSAAFVGSDGMSKIGWSGTKDIDYRRVSMCSYSSTNSQPMGMSPFESLYILWREKQLLQDILLVGVQRDLSGVPLLRLPSEVMEAAEADPTSAEALQVASLQNSLYEMHQGDAVSVTLPSDTQNESGSGSLDYSIELMGITGGGKNFDIVEIIEQKKKGIHMVLGTQHLLTGEGGGGSLNLHEGQVASSALMSKRDNIIVDEMWNKQIFPLLLDLNSIEYKEEDLPKWVSGNSQPLSIDEFGKGVQRCKSFLPMKPEIINEILSGLGMQYRVDESMTTEELREIMSDVPDNSGEGDGSSGVGDTQSGGASSDNNADNAS